MRSKSFEGMACSIAGALEVIGDRWAVLILRDLMFGLSKYDDLRRSTGMPHATLADRLKHLEENELIERRPYQSNPERYEYILTRKGWDSALITQALLQVGDKWAVTGDLGPPVRLIDRKSGRRLKLALVDVQTGALVKPENAVPKEGPGADDLVRWRVKTFRERHGNRSS